MKKTLLYLSFIMISQLLCAQSEIILHIAPRLGSDLFGLNKSTNAVGFTYPYKITRLDYYISEIKITHDGGQVTPVDGLFLLVRPVVDSMYTLGILADINKVENIIFSVGVDPQHNHLDPATYGPTHPLAPKNPEMQWGWSAGYRFVAIEGNAGKTFNQHFEVHAIGDANYKTVTINTEAEEISPNLKMIHLNADYSQILKSINVSSGLILHGSSGAAVTLLNNMNKLVFTAEGVTATLDPAFKGSVSIAPNPTSFDNVHIDFNLEKGNQYAVEVYNSIGNRIIYKSILSGNSNLTLNQLDKSGLYFVRLLQNNRAVFVDKLIISE
ncbi:MAG: MbnP family protein [Saprospiraceae bacterium]